VIIIEFEAFSILSHTKVNDFVNFLEKGKIIGTICKKCGKKYFPSVTDCRKCLSNQFEWVELDNKGKLETFTMISVPPSRVQDYIPPSYNFNHYLIGIIKTNEGFRVMGWIRGLKLEDIEIGMDMKCKPLIFNRRGRKRVTIELIPLK